MQPLKRNFFQRIFGICATKPPADKGCWVLEKGDIVLDLQRAPELSEPTTAVRLEGAGLPVRVLVVHGYDDTYYAFPNRCTHAGRRLDPLPGEDKVQCCSIGKSVFDYEGKRISGMAQKDLAVYPVAYEGNRLRITLA